MSEELKACPFCGSNNIRPAQEESGVICRNCGTEGYHSWNTRPLEDALRARIAELEASDKYDTELTEKRFDEEATLWKRIVERRDERIKELEDANRWIPVSEKPATVTRVLVYMKNNYIVIATYYKHINAWKNDCGGRIKGDNIIKWQYLPMPTLPEVEG